jgi:hypothetical protein
LKTTTRKFREKEEKMLKKIATLEEELVGMLVMINLLLLGEKGKRIGQSQ